jgi:hypothetical protein
MIKYEHPTFIEIKMDAEIGSYQEDQDPTHDPFFGVAPERIEIVQVTE